MTEEEYIEYTKDVLTSSKEELPTFRLQIISLVRFMRAAGYEPVDPEKPIRFKLTQPKEKFPLDVNLVNAVHLHNYGFFYEDYNGYVIPTMIRFTKPVRVLEEACNQKVVREIYLQWAKRRKEWIVNKHQIKFMEDECESLKLKACPFCESPVRWCGENEPDPEDNHACHHIVCTNKECEADFDYQIQEWTEEDEDLPLEEHFGRLREQCAERFNRRPNGKSNSC